MLGKFKGFSELEFGGKSRKSCVFNKGLPNCPAYVELTLNNVKSYAVKIGSVKNKGLNGNTTFRKLLILRSTA